MRITNILLAFLVCMMFIGICELAALYDVVRTGKVKQEIKKNE